MDSWSVPGVGVPTGLVWGERETDWERDVRRLGKKTSRSSLKWVFSHVLCALILMWTELPLVPA